MKKLFLITFFLFSNIYAVTISARFSSSNKCIVETALILAKSKYVHGAVGSMAITVLADLIAQEIMIEEDEDFPSTFYEQIVIYSILGAIIASPLLNKLVTITSLGHIVILSTATISALVMGIPRTLMSSVRKKTKMFGETKYKTKDHVKNTIKQAILNTSALLIAYFGSKGLTKLDYC